jgi:hypothetical protein
MPIFTGDREWLVEELAPNADNPLPGIIVRGHSPDFLPMDGPAWRFAPDGEAEARAQAARIAEHRNEQEARARAARQAGG